MSLYRDSLQQLRSQVLLLIPEWASYKYRSRVMFEKLCTDLQKSVFWISKCFVFQTIHRCGELHFGIWRHFTEGCSRTVEEKTGKRRRKRSCSLLTFFWHRWEAWWGNGKMWRRIHDSGLLNAGQVGLPCWDTSPALPDPAVFYAGCVKKGLIC